ncbi:MAG: hypothetical protein KC431_12580 [Myxococcales bacterium]|nr:hypothetical protein [Myxococcales bacterium]
MNDLKLLGMTLTLALATVACTDDGGNTDEVGDTTTDTTTDTGTDTADTGTDTTDTTETGELVCPTHDPIDGQIEGAPCVLNTDCASQVCVNFQAVPPSEGSCGEVTGDCATRALGRVLDFGTRQSVAGIDIRVAAALAAAGDPGGADALISATSDANGEFDAVSVEQISAPLGIVALTEGAGYYRTATGLASPADGSSYGPATTQRDVWIVPETLLTDWSALLDPDPDFTNALPLGAEGGVVGMVRDVATGDPISGAVIVPVQGDTSNAVIRYLNDAGDGFVDTGTTSQGTFVLVKPAVGEEFDVEIGGTPQGLVAKAGSALSGGAVFTVIFNVP